MGIVWEIGFAEFLLVSLCLGGGAAYMTGRAMALTWRQLPQLLFFTLLLSLAVRFIHFALFHGSFFKVDIAADGTITWGQALRAVHYWVVDLVVLLLFAGFGFQLTRARQMTRLYSWIYERSGGLGWRQRTTSEPPS